MVPPPPAPFPRFNATGLAAGTRLVHIHNPVLDGAAYNPCLGGPTRFAPIHNAAGACIPTLYAAASFKAAVRESVFHDLPYDAPDRRVRLGRALPLAISEIELQRDLRLARLHENDLNRLGTTRSQLIDTPAATYGETARWAEAFHAADPEVAGLVWSSRRSEPEQAYLLFGDRASAADWVVVATETFATAPARLIALQAVAREDGIVLTL